MTSQQQTVTSGERSAVNVADPVRLSSLNRPLGWVSHQFATSDMAPLLLLVVAVLLMFWKVVFTSHMLFYRDVFNYTYPAARFIHEVCRQGHLPYWNPYLNYGQQLLANPNFLFFYPYTAAIVLLPVDFAYTMHYVLHFILAAIGVYWLARRWGQSRAAGLAAGLLFVLSGPVLSLGSFYNHVACAAWIPWAVLVTDIAIEGCSLRPWLLLSGVFGLQFLAGEPFTLLATVGLCAVYALYWVVQPRLDPSVEEAKPGPARREVVGESKWQSRARVLLGFAVSGCLALGLSGILLLPSTQLLRNSVRGAHGMAFAETTFWSFHPLSLLEMVLPNFYGSSLENPTAWTEAVGTPNTPYFPSVFLGFVPLFLALVGWAWGCDRRRNFVAGASVLFLLLAMGRHTPVFTLVYWLVPPLRLVRFPVKLLVFFVLLAAILAGWGVDALRDPRQISRRTRARVLLPIGFILVAAILGWATAWLAPGVIMMAAGRAFVRAKSLFPEPMHPLASEEILQAATFFLEMLRLLLPGLAGFCLAAIAWLAAIDRGKGWARRGLPLAVGIGILQLILTNYSVNPTVSKSFYTYRPPVLDRVERGSQPYRFAYIQRDPFYPPEKSGSGSFINLDSIREAAGFSVLAQSGFASRLTLSHGSMLAKVEAVQNIDLDKSLPSSFVEFWVFLLRQSQDLAHHDCLLGRSNVKYLIRARLPSAAVKEVGAVFNGSAQPSVLYETRCYTPRTYIATSAVHSSSAFTTLSRLSDPSFNPEENVYISLDPGSSERLPEPRSAALQGGMLSTANLIGLRTKALRLGRSTESRGPSADRAAQPLENTVLAQTLKPGGASAGQVRIVDDQPDAVTVRSELSPPGYVVLLDRYDPNWHASLDGRQVPILRANHIFRAVQAGAGTHVVRFEYRQYGLRAGAALSTCSIVLLVVLWKRDPGRSAQKREPSKAA